MAKCCAMPSARYILSAKVNPDPVHCCNLTPIAPSLMRAKFEYMDDDVTFPNTERAPKSYFWQSYHDMFLHILLKIAENPTSCGRAVGPDKTGSPLAEEGKPVNRLERFGRAADGVPPLRNQKFADSPLEEDGFEPSVPRGETRTRNPPLDSPECRSVVHQQTNSRL